jgi:glycosyltransferase involved in cell wall biosynthesis
VSLLISIVTPLHNEAENLPELVARVARTMAPWCASRPGADWELLACDDHSTDDSAAVLARLAQEEPRLRPLRNPRRSGQTGGFATGFANARGAIIVTMDGDLQVRPEDIPALLAPLERGERDVTNAVRVGRQHDLAMIAISRVGNAILRALTPCPVADAASNFTALRADLVRGLALIENDHRYLIPMLIHRGLDPDRVADVPLPHESRRRGASKYRALEKAARGAPEILRFRQRLRAGFYGGPTRDRTPPRSRPGAP